MRFIQTLTMIVCILFTVNFYAHAQKGILKGVVKEDKTNETVPFLNIYTSDRAVGATTDFDGNYQMELDAGEYEIVFSSVEFGKTTFKTTIRAGETTTLNVSLSKADVKMETIFVKTDKYSKPIEEITYSLEIIKPNIIENKASTDVTSALEQAPGLTIVDNEPQLRAGSGYSFGAGSRVMILVDDLPMLSGDAGRPSWSFIPIENVEQIEVIKGASSVLYGSSALNGVINVRTAYPTYTPKTVINLNTGVWNAPRMKSAKWWGEDVPFYTGMSFLRSKRTSENFSFTLGGNVYMERGFIGPARQDTLLPMNEDLLPGSFSNRARLNFTTNIKSKRVRGLSYGFNGNFMYSRSTSILIWDNDTTGLYRSRPGATTVTKQPQFNFDPYIKYFDKNGNTFSLNTRIYYVNNLNDNNQQNDNTVYYGEFRYLKNFQKIPNFTLSTGVMAQHVIGSSELYAAGNEGSVKRDQSNIAIYAQLDKKMWERVNFTLGGRWEYFREDTLNANRPIFRAGASARLAKATFLRASFGQGFRFPTIAEKYIFTDLGGYSIVPNNTLKPEDSWSAEIGIKQGIKIKKFLGYLDIAGFTNFYDNYIEFIANIWKSPIPGNPPVVGFRSLNTGRARVTGLDISLLGQGNFTDDLSLSMLIGYTWSRPVSLDPDVPYANVADALFFPSFVVSYNSTSSDTRHNVLKYRYEHLLKADLELSYKVVSMGVSFRSYSFMRNVDNVFLNEDIGSVVSFRERNNGPEHVLDWRFGYNVSETSRVSLVINNMLNREYALRPLVINAPRLIALQYTLRM